jgi:SEC-C motif domain protein
VKSLVCPCRVREKAPRLYEQCCGPLHGARQLAATPEALMRSRYSAYALLHAGGVPNESMYRYLLSSWHPGTLPEDLELNRIQWIGLDVLDTLNDAETGMVEFKAWFKSNGKAQCVHERSRFIKLGPAWLYLDGNGSRDTGLGPARPD